MSCGTMRAGRAVEATNSGSLREPNSNARRGRQKDSGARLFARRKSPSRSTATPREPSRRRPAQRMRKPLRFRAARDLSRPTPTRTALKPESREGRRNQRLRQFGHPEKRQSRTLGQANRLRRHWNRNPVMALKRLRRNGRSGKSRRPAILEYGPSPDAAGGRRYRKPNYARGRDRIWRVGQARSRTGTSTAASSGETRRSRSTNKLAVCDGTRRPRMMCETRSSAPHEGAADRLDFTVIGPAVNDVVRIEKLCERLNRQILFPSRRAPWARSCNVTDSPQRTL